ncbi:hypothetical protein TD95_001829 [Thielaviopsis punctulata]|uniref:Cytosolic Fe-S cluster assembly factor NAR1 n=1 Tax=Thielaviopsis punctulata TaxID=72032 RepID=A0A0F4ZAG9_9PEZI|nr:hypothetical protein TD95_001829 [Thielaviopsis punctulata]
MSAILSADDLNDFITPGVACIKPVETLPAATTPDLAHEVILDGTPGSAAAPAPAQISLTDCLACSGCVTSAEAVLVSLQSHAEVLSALDAAPSLALGADGSVAGLHHPLARIYVASVAPQVCASLAAAWGVSAAAAAAALDALLRQELSRGGRFGNAFTWVVDTNTAREACLVLGADEALSTDRKTPTLAASCPGWVCYAEKTHPYVLPHLSHVKSPQALLGTMLKTALSRTLQIAPSRVWHLAIMPCFDKKLEASREELTDAAWSSSSSSSPPVRDVDCVITTAEILSLASARSIPLPPSSSSPTPAPPFPDPILAPFLFRPRSALRSPALAGPSGGYLYFLLSAVSAQHPGSHISAVRGRNADVVEYTVLSATQTPLLRAARYYGFRNIQNLVRRLKPARASRMPGGKPFGSARRPAAAAAGLEYAYVEVMACPGGCTNGGGQIKADASIVVQRNTVNGAVEHKAWLAAVDEAYYSADEAEVEKSADGEDRGHMVQGVDTEYVRGVLRSWAQSMGVPLEKLAYTTYREVVSDVGKKDMTQTERAAQIAGRIGGGW